MKMAGNDDYSTRQDWCDEVENEENLPPNNQGRVGQKYEYFRDNGAHSGQAKEKLEEEMTRLALVMTENKSLLQDMLTCIQETDDELRLVLKLIRADLEKSSTESVPSEEVKKRNEMEQEIIANLIELVEGQEAIKSKLNHHSKTVDVIKLFETMTLQHNQEREKAIKPPLKCYWCHEEGHFKRVCPHRFNKERWMQTPAFKQKTAFRHKPNINEMISMSWPSEESHEADVINMGQSRRENTMVNYNPLNY